MDAFFTATFECSPIGQCLLAPTPALEIIAVNDAFLRGVSRSRGEVLNLPLFEAFPADPEDTGDTGVPALARSIERAIATGQAQLMPVQRYPIRMTRDGRSWFEDMYWSATNTPLYDSAGRLLCVSHTTIDITTQVLAQQAAESAREQAVRSAQVAEANRAHLTAVLQSTPVGIIILDADGRLLHRNPANEALFGPIPLRDGVLEFDAWRGWFSGGERAGERIGSDEWPLCHALKGETVARCPLEIESFLPGNPRRFLLVSAAPIIDASGRQVGATAASMDIEDRIRAEQALIAADRRKDEFLAMLAHELRNPLAPIGAAASLLALPGVDAGRLRQTVAVISRQVRHMSDLIDELLDVARVTRGLITLERAPLDMKRIVAEAIEQVRPAIEARRHTLEVTQPPSTAFVQGDRKRLVQVLSNLLNNAAKFTPEGGRIHVELAIDPDHVRIAVADSGIGLAPDMLDAVFGLFVQGKRSADRHQGGLGIGLALAHSLVALHGGSVRAESEGVGKGARFIVCLPLLPDASAPAGGSERWEPALNRTSLSILAVDDNEDALEMLEMLLVSLGHRVASLANPHDAVARAVELRPDVCLLDIGLPDIDGLTLARALRGDPRTAGSVLIALSGYGQDSDRQAAQAAGFDHYFVKPVDVARLTAVLDGVASRARG